MKAPIKNRDWLLHAAFACTAALALTLIPPTSVAAQEVVSGPPETEVRTVYDTLHGVVIADPYRWLEDQGSPETRAWIKRQNAYTESMIGELPGREALEERLGELLKIDVIGTPTARGDRYFFSKRVAGQDLFVIYMREGVNGEDEVLIDPHEWSEDHRTSANMLTVSEDGSVVAYGVREGGEDEVEVRFLDVESRTDLADRLPRGRYFGISLTPDLSGMYYTHFTQEGARVYYHEMGSDPADDELIFGEGFGPDKLIFSGLSPDGDFLGIVVLHGSSGPTELYYKNVAEDGPILAIDDQARGRSFPSIAGDQVVIQTNWEAPNGRVMRASRDNPGIENWEEIIPESDAVIRSVSLAGGKIFVNYLEDVQSRVEIFDIDGVREGEISFPTLGNVSGVAGRWDRDEAFFSFSSFAVPTTIYRYQVSTGAQGVWAELDVPVDSDEFTVKQVWYESKDKTKVPMFLVHQKGLELNGDNPVYLTGYGGFNVSRTPNYSSSAVLAVEHGLVYALPNLRGGGEFGEEWHRAGMFENKQNVFDDFIAAAEWLIENDYTRPGKLAIAGGSNGGLLVGAAMTQRPDLFGAVICSYPLLDMVRYHKFLVGRFWVSEYGSADNAEQFEYILDYSPYHNVEVGADYPAVLFITGDADTRVAPLHARKMAALMQAKTGSDEPILLKYDTKAGHSGGTPVTKQIQDAADSWMFLLWQLDELEGAAAEPTSSGAGR